VTAAIVTVVVDASAPAGIVNEEPSAIVIVPPEGPMDADVVELLVELVLRATLVVITSATHARRQLLGYVLIVFPLFPDDNPTHGRTPRSRQLPPRRACSSRSIAAQSRYRRADAHAAYRLSFATNRAVAPPLRRA
jgi:hypothetical protein